jgi:di/tricarboxylate transporter
VPLIDRRPALGVADDHAAADALERLADSHVDPILVARSIGQTIEAADLRHLPGAYLAEIDRDGDILPAVGPEERLRANDRLVFAGVVESMVDLQKIRGLAPATDQVFKLDAPRERRATIEAVVSDSCPLIGRTVRDGEFRSVYNAVIIAVARNGELVRRRIGDIVLRAGDTLLLEAAPAFVKAHRDSRDFFLVSNVAEGSVPRHRKAGLAVLILAGMVTAATLDLLPMLLAAVVAAGLLIATRCVDWVVAKRAIDLQVLIVIGAALGVGSALEVTGAAQTIASGVIRLAGTDPWTALVVVYLVTMLFTEMITNNAAAALVFPIALATAESLQVDFRPFAIAIAMAASASFSTPIGYQTNLMVLGPGGYRFSDYFRMGIPLNLLMWLVASLLIPRLWPF